jgi:hypothetical protein
MMTFVVLATAHSSRAKLFTGLVLLFVREQDRLGWESNTMQCNCDEDDSLDNITQLRVQLEAKLCRS